MSFRVLALAWIGALLTASGLILAADQYRGAEYALEQVQKGIGSKNKIRVAPELARLIEHQQACQNLKEALPHISDDEAVARWLTLLDQAQRLRDSREEFLEHGIFLNSSNLRFVLGLLPRPSAWPALSMQIDQRPLPAEPEAALKAHSLRLLGHMLANARQAQQDDMAAMLALVTPKPKKPTTIWKLLFTGEEEHGPFRDGQQFSLVLQLCESAGLPIDADDRIALWKFQHAAASGYGSASVPDLVSWVGSERAEPLLLHWLKSNRTGWVEIESPETKALATRLAIEHVAEINNPPCTLLAETKDLALLEKLLSSRKVFRNDETHRLKMQYVLQLLLASRAADAEQFITGRIGKWSPHADGHGQFLKPEELARFVELLGHSYFQHAYQTRPEFNEATFQLYEKLRLKLPSSDVWNGYLRSSLPIGKVEQAIADTKAFLERPEADLTDKQAVTRELVNLYLADDQIEPAFELLRSLQEKKSAESNDAEQGAIQLIELGKALDHPAMIKFGANSLNALLQSSDLSNRVYSIASLVETLAPIGQQQEAERALIGALRSAVQRAKQSPNDDDLKWYDTRKLLAQLTAIYSESGRHADVLLLAKDAPWWGLRDVSQLRSEHAYLGGYVPGISPVYCVAKALASKGQTADALPLALALVNEDGTRDLYYELLVDIEGQRAIARLDELLARHPLEERPLIWKAKLLLATGKLEEAEIAVRQAIAIDPSDANQERGERRLAYAVLSDILERRGGTEPIAEARRHRNTVKAIRLTEQAELCREIGLRRRAIQKYREALTLAADLDIVHLGLARELAAVGQFEEAAKHYARAFELMPHCFGPVEPYHVHGARFVENELAQSIAERTFVTFTEQHPQDPQGFYLLGNLRAAQERSKEALAAYRMAVKCDNKHSNAWRQIKHLAAQLEPPGDAEAELATGVLPQAHRSWGVFVALHDLPKLWGTIEAGLSREPKTPKHLWPLPASTTLLDKTEGSLPNNWDADRIQRQFLDDDNEPPTWPAQVLLQEHAAWSAASQLLFDRN